MTTRTMTTLTVEEDVEDHNTDRLDRNTGPGKGKSVRNAVTNTQQATESEDQAAVVTSLIPSTITQQPQILQPMRSSS